MDELENLLKIIHLCCRDTYTLGGGQLKDWKNPFGTTASSMNEWIQCYNAPNMKNIVDKTGRRFWYDPKWESIEKST